jgi:hypothetical protein
VNGHRWGDPAHAKRLEPGKVEGIVESVTTADGKTTVTLKGGLSVTTVTPALQVIDRRNLHSGARPSHLAVTAIAPGQTVVIITRPATAHHAAVTKIKIKG